MSHWATMLDSLQNFVTGLGKPGVDSSTSVQYILNLIDRQSLENMYRGDWLSRKIVDAPADDMTREWRAWQASQQQIEAIEQAEKALDLQRKVKSWISKARLYGGAALMLGVDDGNDPSQPLDLDRCKKDCIKYVVPLNLWELNAGPRIYNVRDPYFSRPAYYTVATPMYESVETGAAMRSFNSPNVMQPAPAQPKRGFFNNIIPFSRQPQTPVDPTAPYSLGTTQIHPSRVLDMPGNELPDWRLAPMGGGWGDSVLQTVVDDMQAFTQLNRSVSAMVSDGKLDVVKIPDMALNLTTPGYKNKLIERFALSTQTKSVISALLLDKEEEWERVNTQFSGLPLIMHEFMTLISGAADIPVSRLFGQARGQGLNGGSTAGGADDLRNYYDNCTSKQKTDVAPRIGILDQVLMRHALGKEDPNIHYNWNPLWQLTDAEKAEIAYKKSQSTQIYSTIGIINSDALREGVVNQLIEDGTYPGLDDAIEEFGAEPEIDSETGGYMQPNAMPAVNSAQMAIEAAKAKENGGNGNGGKPAFGKAKDALLLDFNPDQPRGPSGPGTNAGSFAPSEGGGEQQGGGGSTGEQQMAGEARVEQLNKQWAYLDKQLFQYVDMSPSDRVVSSLVRAQIQNRDAVHAVRLAQNGGEGSTSKPGTVRDVAVIGAGPAGISAGIYGGSEGLDTVVAESVEIGGQAGKSSRIENVMGFPTGVSGEKLVADGVQQAKRLGADIQIGKQATGLSYDPKTGNKTISFADGSSVEAKAVVIAGGVQFNKVKIPGSDCPDVVYGSSGDLKERVRGGDAIIVGGANSAGQAAMDTAITSRNVTLMARGGIDNMSKYLVDQINANPHIKVMKGEITQISQDKDGRMNGAVLKDGTLLPAKGVLYAIGSKPATGWAAGIERDERGFIRVGGDGREDLETNIPGVFAAGDVRQGSVKRVITAAADGAAAISMVHAYIDKRSKSVKDVRDAKFIVQPGKDAATVWLHKVNAYDKKVQTHTGYPAPGDEGIYD